MKYMGKNSGLQEPPSFDDKEVHARITRPSRLTSIASSLDTCSCHQFWWFLFKDHEMNVAAVSFKSKKA